MASGRFAVVTLAVAGDLDDAGVIEASWRDTEQFAVLYDRYAAQLHRYAHRRARATGGSWRCRAAAPG